MDIIEELKIKKKKIEELKQTNLRLEGELKQQLKRLKDDFGVDSIEKAEELLSQYEEEQKEIELELAKCKRILDKIDI